MKSLKTLAKEYEEVYKTGGFHADTVSTGYRKLDDYVRGWVSGHLVILAGRPSMGKTSFAISCMVEGAKKGHRSCFFSIESSEWEIFKKIYENTNGTAMDKLDIHVDDRGLLSISSIVRECSRLNPRLVLVDYLQLLTPESTSSGNRNDEVGEISRGLKRIAKEHECTVIALSQLSRATERRENSRPQLSDLRDSGAIEQDADIVLMMYRPDMYREFPTGDSEVEVLIRKNRDEGTLGFIKYEYNKAKEEFIEQ